MESYLVLSLPLLFYHKKNTKQTVFYEELKKLDPNKEYVDIRMFSDVGGPTNHLPYSDKFIMSFGTYRVNKNDIIRCRINDKSFTFITGFTMDEFKNCLYGSILNLKESKELWLEVELSTLQHVPAENAIITFQSSKINLTSYKGNYTIVNTDDVFTIRAFGELYNIKINAQYDAMTGLEIKPPTINMGAAEGEGRPDFIHGDIINQSLTTLTEQIEYRYGLPTQTAQMLTQIVENLHKENLSSAINMELAAEIKSVFAELAPEAEKVLDNVFN